MREPVPHVLPSGQLAGTTTAMLTVHRDWLLDVRVVLVNTDVAARTVNLYLTREGGAARRIVAKDLSLAAGVLYETGTFSVGAGDVLSGDASVADVVDYTISAKRF